MLSPAKLRMIHNLSFIRYIKGGKVDDWHYTKSDNIDRGLSSMSWGLGSAGSRPLSSQKNIAAPMMAESANIGLAVGGAKDINNFRENIKNNYLPLPTDLTYEGLYYDYYFDTGKQKECDKLFCPSYSMAVSEDPLSKQKDYYLSVGLNSGIKEKDFQRKKLNLVVVLDISGSMGSRFDKYYYDQFGKPKELSPEEKKEVEKSKMEIATKSVTSLLDHLNNDDNFGMVLFDDQAYLAKPLSKAGDTDMNSIKGHILEIEPQGGTNMESGMKMASVMFDDISTKNNSDYENRIIFLTDAMPNLGATDENSLLGIIKKNAENNIYTTFIGIGVDFNTQLVESITKIKGANYYSVHNAQEFKKRLDDEFDYMITPLVFDLALNLDTKGFKIEKVYGSPEANEATGEIMKINTLFPSSSEGGETKGGIVLLKLKKISPEAEIVLKTSYKDRDGKVDGDEEEIIFNDNNIDFYDNNGIRKAILLARYGDMIKNWINDERLAANNEKPVAPSINYEKGIIIPIVPQLGKWERQSMPLTVSDEYQNLFLNFGKYFILEKNATQDDTLVQEINVLNDLTNNKLLNPAVTNDCKKTDGQISTSTECLNLTE